jgi:spore germination cell wall hydrolase CwlJ-like protein
MKDILLSLIMFLSPTEFNCLAQNVYYEARNQPIEGQLAVADVTLNRMEDDRWPDTICGVVEQKYQFSWVGEVKEEPRGKAWRVAQEVALQSLISSERINATHFHATYVNPDWACKKKKVKKIKDHVFYA